jgi:hypothetical protein
MKNPKAAGGVIERGLVTRYLRRKLAQAKRDGEAANAYPWQDFVAEMLRWLKAQPVRTSKRGGIGR